ncbi:hypothetical protein BMW24_019175 [Mycobacterium heckeshornense]|uniref:hypothetical protein n=1 Tax=Mycobacterium heckeshornense TaxID=110505 RepID=UPI0006621F20|nr:hypothetical protein [Mycobacterium heckeshornense]KMV21930.1 hypothetical protein ACT16_14080 [Mycobacterium heckeshornense]MCV7036831.1 hypothetical protein [Mycobacterium heckeshornense]PIJ32287.1 hypothetical protein BMW24_019175 [Mycobacterium heckeshornense]
MAGVSPLPTGWPTLSQLRSAQFGHLGQFADWCEHVGAEAEKALAQLAQKVRAPGGVEWEGAAGDAAITQAETDVVIARKFLWSVPDAAEIARRGQDVLQAGKQEALEAVADAQRAGFRVSEAYSVTDTGRATSRAQQEKRLAEAVAHSNFIRHRVGMLVGNEQRVSAELKEATAAWGTLTFAQSPTAKVRGSGVTDGIPLGFHDILQGRIVWCVPGPRGGPWAFHCEILYPDGTTDMYYTDEDESGGHL